MNILIAGANGGIGAALCRQLHGDQHRIFTISRGGQPKHCSDAHLSTDLSDAKSVVEIKNWLAEQSITLDGVICCSGVLHTQQTETEPSRGPEKQLSQLTTDWLHQNMLLNVAPSIHLAQAIQQSVTRKASLRWLSLSAMVGSIEDNQLGGWYSYRMTKAALNMFIRNLSIEWGRKSPDSIVAAIHPGTTDTSLSKPFQAGIAADKLYSPELSAQRITNVFNELSQRQHGRLLHWDGSIIPF